MTTTKTQPLKALLIRDEDTAIAFSKAHGEYPFNDNGGPADGSAWLLPLDEVPERLMGRLDEFGTVVEAEERDYSPREEGLPESRPDFEGDWTGWTFTDHAIVRTS